MKPFQFLAALLLALLLVPLASAATVRPEQDMTTYTMDPVAANNTDLIKVECLTTHQIEVQISGTWSATISFQGSNDDTNYTAIQAFPIGGGAPVSTTTATGQWVIPVTSRWTRVRVTAYTSGTTAGIAVTRDRPSDIPTSQITLAANQSTNVAQINGATAAVNNGTASTGTLRVAIASDNTANSNPWLVSGSAAHSAASTGNPVRIGGRVQTAADTTLVAGDVSDLWMTTGGAQVVKQWAIPEMDWQYAAAASGITNTTTAVTIKTAAAAGVRNYVTSIQVMSEALGAATELAIRDGAAGTVIWRTKIGVGGITSGQTFTFNSPLKGTAATLLEVVTLSASVTGAVYFNAQGYTAP